MIVSRTVLITGCQAYLLANILVNLHCTGFEAGLLNSNAQYTIPIHPATLYVRNRVIECTAGIRRTVHTHSGPSSVTWAIIVNYSRKYFIFCIHNSNAIMLCNFIHFKYIFNCIHIHFIRFKNFFRLKKRSQGL